ncbi:MAG: hypothetical protein Q9168_003090 [Polycauliona sp. 1 TL-2023]
MDSSTPSAQRPVGWEYQVMPSLPILGYKGNLLMEIRRPKGDTRHIEARTFGSLDMIEQDIYAIPEMTDTAVRRLINCANKVAELDPEEGSSVADMHRFLLARDLRPNPPTDLLVGLNAQQQQYKVVRVVERMTPTQKRAWDHIRVSPHQVVLLQGPRGTGKTTFNAMVCEILEICGMPYQGAAASNAGTDALATIAHVACLKSGIIRGHSMNTETGPMKEHSVQPGQHSGHLRFFKGPDAVTMRTAQSAEESAEEPPSTEEIDAAQRDALFAKLMIDLTQKKLNKQWRDMKAPRPNHLEMELLIRVMQNVGLLPAKIPCFKRGRRQANPHADFANMIQGGNKPRLEKTKFAQCVRLRKIAIVDTITKTNRLITQPKRYTKNRLGVAAKTISTRLRPVTEANNIDISSSIDLYGLIADFVNDLWEATNALIIELMHDLKTQGPNSPMVPIVWLVYVFHIYFYTTLIRSIATVVWAVLLLGSTGTKKLYGGMGIL